MSVSDETERRLLAALREPLGLALLTLLGVVGGGWVGDIIKGECLGLFGLRSCAQNGFDSLGLLMALAVFSLGAAGLAAATRAYLPVRQLRASTSPKGHRALVLALSPLQEGVQVEGDGRSIVLGALRVVLTGDITGDIRGLASSRINTIQLLRALAPHVGALERLVLLASSGDLGSAGARPQMARLLARYIPGAVIDCDFPPVDFENLDALRQQITDACGGLMKQGIPSADIMLDVTGGQKTTSIAAALATLHQPGLQFQYVSSLPPHTVLTFDVVSESPLRVS